MSVRPVLLLGGDHLARAHASNGQHHPGGIPPTSPHLAQYPGGLPGMQLAKYPEVALFSQLGQLFPKTSASSAAPPSAPSSAPRDAPSPDSRAGKAKTDAKSSYASRHQAAEQRRRMRINDRLDQLRTIVPHAERANTAAFLDEVIKHISTLKDRVKELEEKLGEDGEPAAEEKAGGKKRKAADEGAGKEKAARAEN